MFGWQTLELPGGFEMWTLPGYGDHLERDNPELRKNDGRDGRAGGLRGRRRVARPDRRRPAGHPAHWNVTFAVDDADAIADRATELGGKVLMPPFDAPWVRMTVIADPQGATFTASKFVPENRDLAQPAT